MISFLHSLQLYVDGCNIVSFVNELRPFPLIHFRLRLKAAVSLFAVANELLGNAF